MSNSSAGAKTPDLAGPEMLAALQHVVPAHVKAPDAFAAVMCAFTQRLTGGEARHVLTDLPVSVGVLFSTCALHRDERADAFDESGFLDRVAAHLGISVDEALPLARAVMSLVQRRLSPEVVAHVASQLPADIELMWREAGAGSTVAPHP